MTPVDLATNDLGTPIQLTTTVGENVDPGALALSADGTSAYVATSSPAGLLPINLVTHTAGSLIPLTGLPHGVAIAPSDATTVYVSTDGAVIPVDLSTHSARPAIPVTDTAGVELFPDSIVVTPSGAMAYVTDLLGAVIPIDLRTNTVGTPLPVGTGGSGAIAIAP